MTRLFLAAGVAAMAISAPVNAKRERGDQPRAERTERQAQRTQRAERAPRVERQRVERQRVERAPRVRAERQARIERTPRIERQRVERQARVDRPQRIERQKVERQARVERTPHIERQRIQRVERQARVDRAPRIERQRVQRVERQARIDRAPRIDRQPVRIAERQNRSQRLDRQALHAARVDNRFDRQTVQVNRDARRFDRQALQANRQQLRSQLRTDRLINRDTLRAERQINRDQLRFYREAAQQDLRASRFASLNYANTGSLLAPLVVSQYVGQPISQLSSLSAFPRSISYLYPDNDDYYYRYGGGYAYRVDRDNDLIDYILPILAGGFLPGQYLPSSYMNSYVPNSYGLNSFYPASYGSYGAYGGYGDYGYGYNNYDLCNRYYGGVVYQVDCSSGYIEDVVPVYAGGYGVGQMLPSSYAYYNVPTQYRSLYYDTGDQNYWYAPGAIYQYDRSSSLITSVAALLAPGFSIGQPLPSGYGMYNVPLSYRDTYYDTPNAWYRYNNGNIYQVDPTSQLVTAIVASVLT